MKLKGHHDPRDGLGTKRVALCERCCTKWKIAQRARWQRFGLGVLAGTCEGCGAGFCVCGGRDGCAKCPRREAKKTTERLFLFVVSRKETRT